MCIRKERFYSFVDPTTFTTSSSILIVTGMPACQVSRQNNRKQGATPCKTCSMGLWADLFKRAVHDDGALLARLRLPRREGTW